MAERVRDWREESANNLGINRIDGSMTSSNIKACRAQGVAW